MLLLGFNRSKYCQVNDQLRLVKTDNDRESEFLSSNADEKRFELTNP